MTKTCSQDEINANADKVANAHPFTQYAPVPVLIVDSDKANRRVSFYARDTSGKAQLFPENRWDDPQIYADCPSSLDCTSRELPEIRASGTLYLAASITDRLSIEATPKWPNSLRLPLTGTARILPTNVVITGIAIETLQVGTVDLFDDKLAVPPSPDNPIQLTLDATPVSLTLTQKCLKEQFGLNVSGSTGTAQIWPTGVVITGIEVETGDRHRGTVDLFDVKLAVSPLLGKTVQLTLDTTPVPLELTQRGLLKFGLDLPGIEDLERAIETIEHMSGAWDIIRAWSVITRWSAIGSPIDSRVQGAALLRRFLHKARPHHNGGGRLRAEQPLCEPGH